MAEKQTCEAKCSCCSIGQRKIGGPGGWRLVLPAILVFILPLIAVLSMALLFRNNREHQTMAIYAALAVMLIVTPILYRHFRKRRGDIDEQQR